MAQSELTPQLSLLEEAVTILFCRVDDAYYRLNPKGHHYKTLKELSDSEVLTLALFQQLRGIESERSFLREVARFFSHLFPGAVGLHPSSLHRRVRKLRRFLEPLRRAILAELVGDPVGCTPVTGSPLLLVQQGRSMIYKAGHETNVKVAHEPTTQCSRPKARRCRHRRWVALACSGKYLTTGCLSGMRSENSEPAQSLLAHRGRLALEWASCEVAAGGEEVSLSTEGMPTPDLHRAPA